MSDFTPTYDMPPRSPLTSGGGFPFPVLAVFDFGFHLCIDFDPSFAPIGDPAADLHSMSEVLGEVLIADERVSRGTGARPTAQIAAKQNVVLMSFRLYLLLSAHATSVPFHLGRRKILLIDIGSTAECYRTNDRGRLLQVMSSR